MGVYKGGFDGMMAQRRVMMKYGGYSQSKKKRRYFRSMAVSYTHLDVYKRQTTNSARAFSKACGINLKTAESGTGGAGYSRAAFLCEIYGGKMCIRDRV